ncbi:hypothetical protein GBF38_011507 [Nibea albiflora]|uniref:Uncharacterized protein n=1 Tax=Nibea albiflora TaxID=240163 RepID=A0ACB7F389_NIBAL|nr:hypothetical protein GBF38_011507 [Nibea albiflora]
MCWTVGQVLVTIRDQRNDLQIPEEREHEMRYHAAEKGHIKLRNLDDHEQLIVTEGHQSDQHLLVDLMKNMLHLDPDQHIQPLEVLTTSWQNQKNVSSNADLEEDQPDTHMENGGWL